MTKIKWDYDKIKKYVEENSSSILLSVDYKNQREKLDFQCECGNLFKTSMDMFIRKNVRQCSNCGYRKGAKKNSLTQDEFLERAYKILGDEFEILECDYRNQLSMIKIKHLVCGEEFHRTAVKIMNGKGVCGVCGSNIKRKKEDVQKEIEGFCNEIEVVNYINSDNVIVRHILCGTTVSRSMTFLRRNKGFHCPKCKSSYGVRKISNYLEENGIKFKREYTFKDCIYKRTLPFDFYLPDYNTCIEFDGGHHFKSFENWGGDEKFLLIRKRDEIKNNYCENNNILLLRISIKEQNNIDDILNNFFNKTIPR